MLGEEVAVGRVVLVKDVLVKVCIVCLLISGGCMATLVFLVEALRTLKYGCHLMGIEMKWMSFGMVLMEDGDMVRNL